MEKATVKPTPKEHVFSIFREYTTSSRAARSLTNLSNSVIETSLNGQNKFIYEILQNADDSFEDRQKDVEVYFTFEHNLLIVQHNGKGFDYRDVERICEYASPIEEVKSTDLSKTGYKGLGFKSLFNISDCIYIHSNGYSFRFDKTYGPDWSSGPWQIIPIWCEYHELPLSEKYSYNDHTVTFILKVNNANQLRNDLKEILDGPELLLFLNHINKLSISYAEKTYALVKMSNNCGRFRIVSIFNNENLASTWLLNTYTQKVTEDIRNSVRRGSRFIYPDKIKNAEEVPFTFALRTNEEVKDIIQISGLCHSTLPTQLKLSLPYHINSYFILNLDRTYLHENEWNEFLIYQLGHLQFCLLRDLAEWPHLKNYVIKIFVRSIQHPYAKFTGAFLRGFIENGNYIAWLPAYRAGGLLKLGEAWTDETKFFKQHFEHIRNEEIERCLIDYDVKFQNNLTELEAKRFTFNELFQDFTVKYFPQLTKDSYINFIYYIYESLRGIPPNHNIVSKLKKVPFLVGKNNTLLSPGNALLEYASNPIPDFLVLNSVDNGYLPPKKADLIKDWLVTLGAKRLVKRGEIIRESVIKWLASGGLSSSNYKERHVDILNYLANGVNELTNYETEELRKKLLILTESKKFEKPELCYFPDAVSVKELSDVISDDYKVSSCYNSYSLIKAFLVRLGVNARLESLDLFKKVISWIEKDEIKCKLTRYNYHPIVEYISQRYPFVKHKLTKEQITQLKHFPVLTCDQSFKKAKECYFDSAIPNIKGLESVFSKSKLVSVELISHHVHEFLKEIGVAVRMAPLTVLRESIFKWIDSGQIRHRVNLHNHQGILSYIADHWRTLRCNGLKSREKELLKLIPILTKSNLFREAFHCYWPVDSLASSREKIPGLETVISSNQLVSSSCYRSENVMSLLSELGVRDLKFTNIYEKYSHYLSRREYVKWFFSELKHHWRGSSHPDEDQLLSYVRQKFKTSTCLLSEDGKMRRSTELYSQQFDTMHDIDPNSVPLLAFGGHLPEELETLLGFRNKLEMTCIVNLLKAVEKKPNLGQERTLKFFKTLLEQLRKEKKEIVEKYQLCLLSQDNKLRPAKDLYYFAEEDAICYADSLYLKRIHGMSHEETLTMAKLCGVNVVPFRHEVTFRGNLTPDDSLKEFYLERLPLIVLQEAAELNEDDSDILECLYDKVSSIVLYKCSKIFVRYPFGDRCQTPFHFRGLKIYTTSKWNGWQKSKTCKYLKDKLGLKSDVTQILDMEMNLEDKKEWFRYNKGRFAKLYSIENKLKKLRSEEPIIEQFLGSQTSSGNEDASSVATEPRPQTPEVETASAAVEAGPRLETSYAVQAGTSEGRKMPPSDSGIGSSVEASTSECSRSESDSNDTHSATPKKRKLSEALEEEPKSHSSSTVVVKGEDLCLKSEKTEDYKPAVENDAEIEIIPAEVTIEDNDVIDLSNESEDQKKFEGSEMSVPQPEKNSSSGESLSNSHVDNTRTENSTHLSGQNEQDNCINSADLRKRPRISLETGNNRSLPNTAVIRSQRPLRGGYRTLSSTVVTTSRGPFQGGNRTFTDSFITSQGSVQLGYPSLTSHYFREGDRPLAHNFIISQGSLQVRYRPLTPQYSSQGGRSLAGNFIPSQGSLQLSYRSLPDTAVITSQGSFQGGFDREKRLKWLHELYVFNYLKSYYAAKYPDSTQASSTDVFMLEGGRSGKLEVIWLNKITDKGLSYDILLRKDGNIKRVVEVESANATAKVFSLTYEESAIKLASLAKDLPGYENKYWVYRVLNTSTSTTSKITFVLYKMLELNLKQ